MYWLEFSTFMMNFKRKNLNLYLWLACCTKVKFASFQSGEFITARVVNPLERKLAKRTLVKFVETIYVRLCFTAAVLIRHVSFSIYIHLQEGHLFLVMCTCLVCWADKQEIKWEICVVSLLQLQPVWWILEGKKCRGPQTWVLG